MCKEIVLSNECKVLKHPPSFYTEIPPFHMPSPPFELPLARNVVDRATEISFEKEELWMTAVSDGLDECIASKKFQVCYRCGGNRRSPQQ